MDSFNNYDPFKQLVKSKLADYKQEVPPFGWERLESSLFDAQKIKALHKRWIGSSVAAVAAALIGVFFVYQNMNTDLPLQTTEFQTTPITAPTNKDNKKLITQQNATEIEKSAPALFADNASSSQSRTSIPITNTKDEETTLNISTNISSVVRDDLTSTTASDEHSKGNVKPADIDEETKQQMIQDFINEGKRSFDFAEDTPKIKRKGRHSISLSGNSGLSSSEQTNTLPTTLRSSVSESYGSYTMAKMQAFNDEKEINPESETTHMQPISFGLVTSFDLTPKLQIETGLTYTYLSSETKSKSSDFSNSEKVQFHYLGIPVNLNYTLLSVNKLDLFVTAGAMIEKDISGKIKYYDEKKASILNSGYANESSSKIKQKNPQLSVGTGLGITYPIYDKAKLFGKVGGRYYINANNEFKTYYSDEKFGLDIQLGIKFNF